MDKLGGLFKDMIGGAQQEPGRQPAAGGPEEQKEQPSAATPGGFGGLFGNFGGLLGSKASDK